MDQFKKQSHKREPKVSAYEFSDNMSRNYKTIMSIEAKINSNKVVDADKVPACRYLENIKEIQHLRLIYIDVNIDRNLYIR